MKSVLTKSVLAQNLALVAIGAIAIGLCLTTILSVLGVVPWLELQARAGDQIWPSFGLWLQIGVTVFAVAVITYLPTVHRLRGIETDRRDFRVSMDDVARAYWVAHQADREGTFTLSAEFDDVRARYEHLRAHPDLDQLEPDVLELAAQMSRETRDLAATYSNDKVNRARTFLKQRQQEIHTYQEQIDAAQRTLDELKRWKQTVLAEDSVADKKRERLENDLAALLEPLGLAPAQDQPQKIVSMSKGKSNKLTSATKSDGKDEKADKRETG